MAGVTFSLRGDREIARLLDSLSGPDLVNRTRRGVRAGAAVMRKDLRKRAQGAQYPKSFRKIATKNSTHGGPSGMSPQTRVGPTSPLHNIFEVGAKGHPIATRKAPVLAGPAGEHFRVRSFFSAGPVHHPGMAARPLTTPAFDATKDEAADAAMDKILEGLR